MPGGAHETIEQLEVTRTEDLAATIELHRPPSPRPGSIDAWPRVVAVVVQPGVEFGSAQVVDFVPERARELAAWIEGEDGLVFEAHSTDYQTEAALRALVAQHFAILKVGPGPDLRVARGAVRAGRDRERVAPGRRALAAARGPGGGDAGRPGPLAGPLPGQRRTSSASPAPSASATAAATTGRYPAVAAAVDRLLANLTRRPPPLPLLSQYLPRQHDAIRAGRLTAEPRALVRAHVGAVAATYARACGGASG